MEYVEGETLAKAIHRGPLERERALEVLDGVAAALDAAHERGVVHRDVKPANVLLGVDGRVKLTDLGVASAASSTRITQVGSVLGTLSYMAPEQLTEQPVTPAADVYALAAVAYEALSGRKARPGETPAAIMLQAEDAAPPDLAAAMPNAPRAAARVLQSGMARDPADRPPSAGALVDQLRAAFAPQAATPQPPQARRATVAQEPPRRRRTPALLALAGILAAGVVVAIVIAASSGGGGGGGGAPATSTTQHRAAAGGSKARTTTSSSAPAQTAAMSPADTVRAFYERAASGRLEDSYALLAPEYKARFGSFAEFRRELGTLRSVRFSALRTVQQTPSSAVVELQDVATHTDRVDHCRGQLALVRSQGGWLINPRSVNCA
jgi:serine/threonine-protein kinase